MNIISKELSGGRILFMRDHQSPVVEEFMATVGQEADAVGAEVVAEDIARIEKIADEFDECIFCCLAEPSIETLSSLYRCIKKRAVLTVVRLSGCDGAEALLKGLRLAGFTDVAEIKGEPAECVAARGRRRNLQIGDVDWVRPAKAESHKPEGKVWLISGAEADDDLIDENELINPDDIAAVPQPAPKVCGVDAQATKKPCKNCTCGLADLKKAGEEVKTSSCGSCYLGDAFRCSRCPYRGLPPFKPGETVQLSAGDLSDLQPFSRNE